MLAEHRGVRRALQVSPEEGCFCQSPVCQLCNMYRATQALKKLIKINIAAVEALLKLRGSQRVDRETQESAVS